MTTTSSLLVPGSPAAAPTQMPVNHPAEVDFSSSEETTVEETTTTPLTVVTESSPAVHAAQPPVIPGEVAVEVQPGARVPLPTREGPTIAQRAVTATKIRVRTIWTRLRPRVTVTAVAMALLILGLAASVMVARQYMDKAAVYQAAAESYQAQANQLAQRSGQLATELKRIRNVPWYKPWAR